MLVQRMLEKLKQLPNNPKLTQFRDVRAVGLLLFLAVVLMVSWSGAKVIQKNYELQKQISQLRQENAVQDLANNNLKLQNQYFNTDQYLELQARQDFGLGQPGEKLILVPRDVAMSFIKADTGGDEKSAPTVHQPAYQRNFEAWIDFFMHRQGSL
jgi:cell division protein FtsB